jgi:glycolate oxidase FAD binding subunit
MTSRLERGTLEARLRRMAPADWFGGDSTAYSIDGMAPSFVIAPDSPEAVAAVIADANADRIAVVPWGGGTHMSLGMLPERYGLAIDLRKLAGLVAYEPADLTVTVQSGTKLADLQAHLTQHGQWVPLDPPSSHEATIGGIIASNRSGPARVAYGTVRDLVIGMTVAVPGGQLVKSGGRVVKNVAGYDLAKMHIGALGTLGLITQVSLKVAPLPKASVSLIALSKDAERLLTVSTEIAQAGLSLTGLILTMPVGASETSLLIRLSGGPAAVERAQAEVTAAAGALGITVEQAPAAAWSSGAPPPGLVRVKVVHQPAGALSVIQRLREAGSDVESMPLAGVTSGAFIAADDATISALLQLRTEVEASGGSLFVEEATTEMKLKLGVWGSPPGSFALMHALKEQMDPNRILSPGRFVGGL